MKIDGKPFRTIWRSGTGVEIIDQTRLPHAFATLRLATMEEAAHAIRAMQVRGAPLIGATAAYGLCLALARDPSDAALEAAYKTLLATRPTAVNLRWALDDMAGVLRPLKPAQRVEAAWKRAAEICDDDVALCEAIGRHGLPLIEKIGHRPVNILTHCNAGWLACVDWGTALAPIYMAHDKGIPVHVWVDETRPRSQGAFLTAWELGRHGVPHTVIVDNAGGHLMQRGQVDLCIVGTDRTTATGDVANKIGTYLKALAAHDNGVPFYVALPSTTIDWTIDDGAKIEIEERAPEEVTRFAGQPVVPAGTKAANPGFDVTPARLVTALITERGVCPASREGLLSLYPERRDRARA
jgi:methylthioribose-1-phosphate isomerase